MTTALAAAWWQSAACHGKDPAWWYTPQARAGREQLSLIATARRGLLVCATCPVLAECHLDAIRDRQVGIIRAGVAYDHAGVATKKCRRCTIAVVGRGSNAEYCSDRCVNLADAERRARERHAPAKGGGPVGAAAAKALLLVLTPQVVHRYWTKVDKRGPDECWEWTAEVSRHGHGRLIIGGAMNHRVRIMARRVAWTLDRGREIGPYEVRDTCGNRRCCNPAHLLSTADAADELPQSDLAEGPRHEPVDVGRKHVRTERPVRPGKDAARVAA